ncbi:MAG TPA: glycosyltransferase family 4 protein [Flavobacteriales bacterium]|nr:glycosyltransferase family 4 protein [Flavobacteriales bacterium]
MKILFHTQYCPPEVGAPQNRIFEFAKQLKKFGHEVTILTAMPNYPKGEIFEEYRGKKTMVEELEGIKIARTSIYATKEKAFTKRLRNYLSFTFSSLRHGKKLVGPQDVVITESPPLFLGWAGYRLSKKLGAKYVFNVSDLWPESAIKLGVLNNKLFIKASFKLEMWCYKKAHAVTGQTKGIVDNIVARGIPKEKVHLITNGVDTDFFSRSNRDENYRGELGIDNKFSVCYAGIHGIAQGLEVIIQSAEILKEHTGIQFIFFGDGPEKSSLIKLVEDKKLTNVKFMPVQPKSIMPKIIASVDCSLIPLRKLDLFKGALPSKMFEALSSELPIIMAVEGEAADLITNSGGGINVEPENAQSIANAVLKLSRNKDLCEQLGKNGRKYVMENYSRDTITRRLEKILMEIAKNK